MSVQPDSAPRTDESSWSSSTTFSYSTAEGADVTLTHVFLGAYRETEVRPSTIDEAATIILHLGTARFELHGSTGLLWRGRCMPGLVNVVARRDALTLTASERIEVLILGIPHLALPSGSVETVVDQVSGRLDIHEPCDAVGLGLGMAFIASLRASASPPRSAAHLARALCSHFVSKHAWLQEAVASTGRSGLAPWQARAATQLLTRGDLQVREVAGACRLSSSAFARQFRATFLLSPNEWKAQQRIDTVKALLLAADVSLADAAARAGFPDQASMTRSFRRLVGATPGAWRSSQREATP